LDHFDSDNYSSILYYLILALNQIEFYWGPCERWINLDENHEDFSIYQRGNIVTWIQFSSSAMTDGKLAHFKERNTKMVIWSIKGRDISRFSTYEVEKEVLFTPFSRFMVLDVRKEVHKESGTEYNAIHLREVEVGLFDCKPILWVDDEIFNPSWENKALMQLASKKIDENIRFICKPSTELATSFLNSIFGLRLKNNPNFRIISDMNRDKTDAGAILMKEIIERGFDKNKKIIYTSDKKKGVEKCQQKGVEITENMKVT
jgi:hypothetical protein